MTIAEFIAANDLGFSCERLSPKIFDCRITCGLRGMDFSHASTTEPTLEEALTRIARAARQHVQSNLQTGMNASRDVASFHHWCVLYGYDPESRADRQRYLTIRRRAEQLKYVIGIPAYKQLLEIANAKTEEADRQNDRGS